VCSEFFRVTSVARDIVELDSVKLVKCVDSVCCG